MNKGIKLNNGKLPLARILLKQFPRAFQEVARCTASGHEKYKNIGDEDWMNWSRVPDGVNVYKDAAVRHLLEAEYSIWDDDTVPYGGSRHLASFAWNALAVLELSLIEEEKNSPTSGIEKVSVYVDLTPEQKEKIEELRRIALEGKSATVTNSDPYYEEPKIFDTSWATQAQDVRLSPDQLIEKQENPEQ